jgi:hypothetical protein
VKARTRRPAVERARPEKLNAWLSPGYRARLAALTASDRYTVGEWIETWIELSERDLEAKRKAKKPS